MIRDIGSLLTNFGEWWNFGGKKKSCTSPNGKYNVLLFVTSSIYNEYCLKFHRTFLLHKKWKYTDLLQGSKTTWFLQSHGSTNIIYWRSFLSSFLINLSVSYKLVVHVLYALSLYHKTLKTFPMNLPYYKISTFLLYKTAISIYRLHCL